MVITLDKHKRPLGHCSEKRARKLIENGRACVYRYYPFTIIIKDLDVRTMEDPPKQEYRIKIDPGSKNTGFSIVEEGPDKVVLFMQLEHRADAIVENIGVRNKIRHNRRQRETWYRHPKFKTGKTKTARPAGWLPPSQRSIGDNIISIVRRFKKLMNITKCSFEAVRFDTQLLDNPDIEGVQYQQGTLLGYELREYLFNRYGHECQYCHGKSDDNIFEWEHMVPKSRGGSDKVSNATLSCRSCNTAKGSMKPDEWLKVLQNKKNPTPLDEARIKGITALLKGTNHRSNKYCAWVTVTRRYIERFLFGIFGDVECSSGGRTKKNRTELGLPKDHHYDALCVGTVPKKGYQDVTNGYCLYIKAMGRGQRLLGQIDNCGFITTKWHDHHKRFYGYQTGDIVAVDIPKGKSKYVGHYMCRLSARDRKSMAVKPAGFAKQFDVNIKYIRLLQHTDGYNYSYRSPIPLGN